MEASIWKRKINIFLLGIPLVLFAGRLGIENQGLALVILAALALIPLAGFVESAVEELAELLGGFLGGLLHTTFSNVAELFIGLSVLLTFGAEGPEIVLGSIAGVIIRNSLLFLGLATLLGALKNGRMSFNAENAGEYSTVFALAVIGLSLPTVAHYILAASGPEPGLCGGGTGEELLVFCRVPLSNALAVVLLVSYLAYVLFAVFHFRADRDLSARAKRGRRESARGRAGFEPALALAEQPDTQALFAEEREHAEEQLEEQEAQLHPKARRVRERRRQQREQREREGKAESLLERSKGLRGALAVLILAVAVAGVFAMSETFAHQAEQFIGPEGPLHDYAFFFGLIVIPIIGGAVELYGATGSARANRMELVMATTAGATIQMILLMVPVMVLVGSSTGHALDLVFKPIEVIIFGAVTFAFMLLSRDGESSLLEGVQLVALWSLLAVTAFFLPPG